MKLIELENMHRMALQLPFFFYLILCEYFGCYLPSGEKNLIKTSQKITEMGIILEFKGNLRKSCQGIFTELMGSLEYI